MKKLTLLPIVSLFLLLNNANAQSFTNYTVASTSTTLPGNEVNDIAIDAQGNKWIGVNNEVSKFDELPGKNIQRQMVWQKIWSLEMLSIKR